MKRFMIYLPSEMKGAWRPAESRMAATKADAIRQFCSDIGYDGPAKAEEVNW